MTLADILITVGLVAVVGVAVFILIRNKKSGKTGCGCGCSDCSKCPSACKQKDESEQNKIHH